MIIKDSLKNSGLHNNEDFFAKWNPQMAYVLGFFCADGCMFMNPRGSRYVSFYSTDRGLIAKIKELLDSEHKIGVRNRDIKSWKKSFSLQIGSKRLFGDLLKLGLLATKAKRLSLPEVPAEYLHHFVRGYFDGDGCVSYGWYKKKNRNKDNFILMVRFASGSKGFLNSLSQKLCSAAGLRGGSLCKNKGGFHLVYAKKDSGKLFDFMYNRLPGDLYLERKYSKFQKAFNLSGAVA